MSMAIDNISDIIQQARGGDTAAFARLVRRYQALVSGVLFSATGDFHQSEDLAQETFLIAWSKLGELENTENPAPWLCTIARNLVSRSFRNKSVNTVHGSLGEDVASREPEPSSEMQRREQSELVWSVIGEMDEKYRETLILYYRSGQSVKEIAEATAATEEAVRQRLVRARKSLKSKLETIIGDILTDTAPGDVFTLTVMTAIGASMLSSTAQAAVATMTGTTTATAVGTGSATGGKALGAATLWSVIGPIAYVGWFFTFFLSTFWAAVRNAPTLRARRFRVYSIFWSLQYYGLLTIACGLGVAGFVMLFSKWVQSWSACIPAFGVFLPLAMLVYLPIQAAYYRKMKGIVKNDIGLPGPAVESYSYQRVEHRFFLSIVTNILVAETLLALLVGIAFFSGECGDPEFFALFFGGIAFVAVVVAVYYPLGRYFLEICRTKRNFLAAPPLVDNPLDVILLKSIKAPGSVDHLMKAGKMSAVFVLSWISIALLGVWYFSHYSWNKYPVVLGICTVSLVGFIVAQTLIPRFIKDRRRAVLFTTLFMPVTAAIMLVMERIEFGTLSLFNWSDYIGTSPQAALMIPNTGRMILFLTIFAVPMNLYRYFKIGREDQSDKISGQDQAIREAINRFDPATMIIDEPEVKAKPFPKCWICVIGLYAVAIVVSWCLGVLVPNSYAQRRQLERSGDYSALIELEPNNPEWYRRRSWEKHSRTFDEMLADVDTAIRLKPNYAWAYLRRAELLGRLDSSISYKSNAADPSEEELQRALADCNEAIRLELKAESCWKTRARIHEKLGDLDAAVADLTETIRVTQPPIRAFGDDWVDPRIFLYGDKGRLNELRQNFHEAILDYTTALQLIGSDKTMIKLLGMDFLRRRGKLYERLGDPDKAKADFDRVK